MVLGRVVCRSPLTMTLMMIDAYGSSPLLLLCSHHQIPLVDLTAILYITYRDLFLVRFPFLFIFTVVKIDPPPPNRRRRITPYVLGIINNCMRDARTFILVVSD